MNLTECIKELCSKYQISINKLEHELKLGQGSIRKWGDSPPSTDRLMLVADYFNVSIDWMLGRRTELSLDEKELLESYRRTNGTGKQITLQNARTNAELMPLEQKLSNLKKA